MRCAIVSDSTCDVPLEVVQRYGIGIAPAIIEVDGQTFLDDVRFSREQFYIDLPSFRTFPKTAAASPETFAELYRKAGAPEVISIHLSQRLSGMYNSARLAAEMVGDAVHVHVFDSQSISMGTGWLVVEAAEMAARGASAAEILTRLTVLRSHTRVYALLDTLKYLHKSGRVGALTAGLGEMLQIKPLIAVKDGEVHLLERVRLKSRGVERLVALVKQHLRVARLAVLYTGPRSDEDLAMLQAQWQAQVPIEMQWVQLVTPTIGAHLGPRGLGAALLLDEA
ncbi:MAG: DegV family protein [Thermoflexales bacterium]|nr:DegV family protein [Thermoflexales bacterium]